MRLLVTGGCGFVGRALIGNLLHGPEPVAIRVLDNLATGSLDQLRELGDVSQDAPDQPLDARSISFVEGDVRGRSLTEDCARGCDAIVHLAANTGVVPSLEDPRFDLDCNVLGTLNVLEAARQQGVPRFIFASSNATLGAAAPPVHEELAAHPLSPYGASKIAGEAYCSAYYHGFGLETVCLRFGNVFGPGSDRKSSVVAKFVRQALRGETCCIYGDGAQTRDFVYIADLVEAIGLALTRPVAGETFQIASGRERSVLEVADCVARELGVHGVEMTIAHERPRAGDAVNSYAATSKAAQLLGWRAQTDFREGIAATVRYFLARQGRA